MMKFERSLALAFALAALAGLSPSAAHSADDPLTVTPSDDIYIDPPLLGKNGGRGAKDDLQLYGFADGKFHRVLLKFDLTQAPPNFRSAVLELTCWNASYTASKASYIRCHPLASAWSEGEASWDMLSAAGKWKTPGGDWDPRAAAGCRVSGPLGGQKNRMFLFDITLQAAQWKMKPNTNNGLVLMAEKGVDMQLRFRSKEFADGATRPKLLLYYGKAADKNAMFIPAQDLAPLAPAGSDTPVITYEPRLGTVKLKEKISVKFSATGGQAPYAFGPSTPLPPGLSLGRDGTLSGEPTRAGSFRIGVLCVAADRKQATEWLNLTVEDPDAPKAKEPEQKTGELPLGGPPKDAAGKTPGGEKDKKDEGPGLVIED